MIKYAGVVVSGLVSLIAGYECAALLTPLPTISRIVQGWRDDGHTAAVVALVVALVVLLLAFAAWVFRHLLFGPRSFNL